MSDWLNEYAKALCEHHLRMQNRLYRDHLGFLCYTSEYISAFDERGFNIRLERDVEEMAGGRDLVSVLPSYHEDIDTWNFTVFGPKRPGEELPPRFEKDVANGGAIPVVSI